MSKYKPRKGVAPEQLELAQIEPVVHTLHETLKWFKQAVPKPTDQQLQVQLGVHLEEVSEMLEALFPVVIDEAVQENVALAIRYLTILGNTFKQSPEPQMYINSVNSDELLDSLADQFVTVTGSAYMAGYDFIGACNEVNRSNYSKFENGTPVFKEGGKIAKGKNYSPPNLTPFIP